MKTKKYFSYWLNQTLLLLLLLLAFSAKAQDKTLLWKVSGNGLTKSSYLFGTIHLLPKSDATLSPKFKKIFDSCQQTCLEIDLQHTSQSQIMGLMKQITLPDDKTLKDYLSEVEYEKLIKIFRDTFHVELSSVNRLKPIFMISNLLDNSMSKDSVTAMEFMLTAENKKQGKNMTGLETLQEQMDVINLLPLDKQFNYLKDIANGKVKDYGVCSFKKLYFLYKAQDIAGLYNEEIQEDGDGMAKFNTQLIDKRNQKWIPKITKIAAQKSTFFAFGAGHLYGKKGVINLLRKAGYRVTPVFK